MSLCCRKLPDHEVKAQQWVLDTIFNCHMSSLPAAMLIHPFWQMFRQRMHVAENYHACLGRKSQKKIKHIRRTLIMCQEPIYDICPPTFDSSNVNVTLCQELLWNNGVWSSAQNFDVDAWSAKIGEWKALRFQQYFMCLGQYEPVLKFCAKVYFDKVCSTKTIRMIKTVRSNMDIPAKFLDQYPNYRLLHFFRDPRGTVRSRLHPNATWSLGIGERDSVYQAAAGYCNVVRQDFLQRQKLETLHPGQILQVTFDSHTHDPKASTSQIYMFVNASHLVSDTKWHVMKRGLELKDANATLVSERWKTEMAQKDVDSVNSACENLLKDTKFD